MKAFLSIGLLLIASPAVADPCNAPLPTREGQTFSGKVGYVVDGDGLCLVTRGGLLEVRLADFNAPELNGPLGRAAKDHLASITRDQWLVCTVTRGRNGRTVSFDRVIAVCRVGGRTLAALLRERGAPEGGN